LGESYPSERAFSEEDFHNFDTSSDIIIQTYFDKAIEDQNGNIEGFELRCKAYKRKTGDKPAGTLKVEYTCIDSHGNQLKYNQSFSPIKVTNDYRTQVPLIFVDVLRDYSAHEPRSRWSILRRLFKDVQIEFGHPKNTVEVTENNQKSKIPRKEAFEKAIHHAFDYLRTEGFVQIEKNLTKNTLEQMGIDGDQNNVSLHFNAYDPNDVYKNVELFVTQMGITTSARDVGAGLQSAIVIAVFRTYQELRKEGAVFAIEEPEVFLHPQKARYFSSILKNLSEAGNQIFITTHSPIFVSIDNPESVVCIRRDQGNGSTATQTKIDCLASNERQELRLLSEFDSQRNEMFFAKKVLFVEGNTEKVSLPLVFKSCGIDMNRLGYSVIECGGKTKIPLFAKAAKAVGIPFMILADEDDPNDSEHKRWNTHLKQVAGTNIKFLVPDFEGVTGVSGNEQNKIDNAIKKFTGISKESLPEAIKEAVNQFEAIQENEGNVHDGF